MKVARLIALLLCIGLFGCGGSGTTVVPQSIVGTFTGTWSDTSGGPSNGTSNVTVDASNNVQFSLADSSGNTPTQTGNGTVDSQGNFNGQVVGTLRNQPASGMITGTPYGISMTITFQLTPGAPGPTHTWYVTGNRLADPL